MLLLLVLLHVSQHALGVEVFEGEESVLLPCKVEVSVSNKSTVVWSREVLKYPNVHVRQHSGDEDEEQNQIYKNRTSMRMDSLETGDLSLSLRKPTISDSGTYICTVRRIGVVLSWTEVQLLVKARSPFWPWILAAVMGPLVLLGGVVGTICGLENKAMKDRLKDQLKVVEVTEGAEDVDLLCTTRVRLTGDIRVEWRRSVPKYEIIHEWVKGQNTPRKGYERRTKMANAPHDGNLTLNLQKPRLDDGGVYICTLYEDTKIVRQKVVILAVRETWIKTLKGLCQCCTKKNRSATDQRLNEPADEEVALRLV